MSQDEKPTTPPGIRLGFTAKVTLGCIAFALLWVIFAPNSQTPFSDKNQPSALPSDAKSNRATPIDIGDATKCSEVITAVDGTDKSTISRVMAYVNRAMRGADQQYVQSGEPGIINQLSENGYLSLMTSAVQYCRQQPGDDLHTATIDAYQGFRELQKSMGVLGENTGRGRRPPQADNGSANTGDPSSDASTPTEKIDILVMRCTSLRSEGSWANYVVVYNMTKHVLAAITTDKADGFSDPNPTTRIKLGQNYLVAGKIKNIRYSAILPGVYSGAKEGLKFVATKSGTRSQTDECAEASE